jgi:hypothetical protein
MYYKDKCDVFNMYRMHLNLFLFLFLFVGLDAQLAFDFKLFGTGNSLTNGVYNILLYSLFQGGINGVLSSDGTGKFHFNFSLYTELYALSLNNSNISSNVVVRTSSSCDASLILPESNCEIASFLYSAPIFDNSPDVYTNSMCTIYSTYSYLAFSSLYVEGILCTRYNAIVSSSPIQKIWFDDEG